MASSTYAIDWSRIVILDGSRYDSIATDRQTREIGSECI